MTFFQREVSLLRWISWRVLLHFKKELVSILHNLFQKIEEERTHPNPLCEANITLIQNQNSTKNQKTIDQYLS